MGSVLKVGRVGAFPLPKRKHILFVLLLHLLPQPVNRAEKEKESRGKRSSDSGMTNPVPSDWLSPREVLSCPLGLV